MKKLLTGLILGLTLALSFSASSQLIYGNDFPYWTVDGALTVKAAGSESFLNLTPSRVICTDSASALTGTCPDSATLSLGNTATLTLGNTSTVTIGNSSTLTLGNSSTIRTGGFYATAVPRTITAATDSPTSSDSYLIGNTTTTMTLTLPDPTIAANSGRTLCVKTVRAGAINSASSNVVLGNTTTAGTAIVTGTAGKFACMVVDGTNYVIFQAN
jgi:hypothetical protein